MVVHPQQQTDRPGRYLNKENIIRFSRFQLAFSERRKSKKKAQPSEPLD